MAKKFNGGGIYFNSEIDDKSFNSTLGKMKNNLGGFASGVLKKVGIAIASAFAVKAVVNFAKEASKLWDAQEEAEKKLGAMMKAQKVYSSENVEEMKKYASELQKITNYGDEAIMPIIANLSKARLSTDQLKEATKQYLNMQASGQSGDMMVKALEKPLEMASSLRRIGVFINEENLKGLDIEKQRAVVLDAIKSKYDGVAEAMVEPDKQLANIIGDIKEQFGKIIDDGLDPLRIQLVEIFSFVSDNIATWIEPIGIVLNMIVNSIIGIVKNLKNGFNSGQLSFISTFFTNMKNASITLFQTWEKIGKFFITTLLPVLKPIMDIINKILAGIINAWREIFNLGNINAIDYGTKQYSREEKDKYRADKLRTALKKLEEEIDYKIEKENKRIDDRYLKDLSWATATQIEELKNKAENLKKEFADSLKKQLKEMKKELADLEGTVISEEQTKEKYKGVHITDFINKLKEGQKPVDDITKTIQELYKELAKLEKEAQDMEGFSGLFASEKKEAIELIEKERERLTILKEIAKIQESMDKTAGKISAVEGVTELSGLPERQRLIGEIESEIAARTIEIESLKNSTDTNIEQIETLEKMNVAQNQALQSAKNMSNQAMALNYILQGLSAVAEGVNQHYADQIEAAGDNEKAAADLAEEQRLAAKGIDIASESIQNFASAGGGLRGLIAMIVGWIMRLISEAARYSRTIGEMFATLGRLFEVVGMFVGIIVQIVELLTVAKSIIDIVMFSLEGLAGMLRIAGAFFNFLFKPFEMFTKMLSQAMDAFDDWLNWLEGYFEGLWDTSYKEEKLVEKQIEAAEAQIAAAEKQITLMEGQLDELGKIKSAVEKAADINEKLLEIEKKRELREYNKDISSQLYTGTLSQIKQGNLYKQGSFDIGLYEAVISESGEVDIELANRLLTRLKYSELDALDIYSSDMKNKLEGLLDNLIKYQEEDNSYLSDVASLEKEYIGLQDELNAIMSTTSYSLETLGKEIFDLIATIGEVSFDELQTAVKASLETTAANWKSSIDVFNLALANLTDDQLVLFTTAIKNLTDSDIQKLGQALSGMAVTLPANLQTIYDALTKAIPTVALTTFGNALSNLSVIDIAKFKSSLPTAELNKAAISGSNLKNSLDKVDTAAYNLMGRLSDISTGSLIDNFSALDRAIIKLKADITEQTKSKRKTELYQTYLRQYEAENREKARVIADKTWAKYNTHYDWGLNVSGYGWMKNRAAFEAAYYDKELADDVIARAKAAAGYASGGYTGYGSISDIAGVVHKRELVNQYPYSEMIMQSLNELEKIKGISKTGATTNGNVNIVINSDIKANNPLELVNEWNKTLKSYNYKIELKRI
jgi:hypothetical protein